ncbi:MAG TPA: amidohydrolase family protein [Thermomicrobiales bacterium]|jgi:hypothetical protein|nr:amidohydrolase family protein [Thermomicrobiales bacterium]
MTSAVPDPAATQTTSGGGKPPPLVVDGHVHAFPDAFIARRAELVARDHWFGHLYANDRAILTNADDLLASMADAGVDHSVVCGFPWSDAGLCREHNDWMAAAVAAAPGRLSWLAIVAPGAPGAAAEAERCLAMGAAGIGELNADGQGFALDDARTLGDLVTVCVAAGSPVLLHSTEPVGHAYPGKGTATPVRLLRFVSAFPDLDVVLAHWGGGLPFYELMPEVAAACSRVRYDTAASPYLYRHDILRTAIGLVGADRIIWGSDYPVLGQRRFLRRTLLTPGLAEADRDAIVGGNAVTTYRLPLALETPGKDTP